MIGGVSKWVSIECSPSLCVGWSQPIKIEYFCELRVFPKRKVFLFPTDLRRVVWKRMNNEILRPLVAIGVGFCFGASLFLIQYIRNREILPPQKKEKLIQEDKKDNCGSGSCCQEKFYLEKYFFQTKVLTLIFWLW